MYDVTRILLKIESGDPAAAEQLLPLVYQELRNLAAAKLSKEKPGQTLQPTILVHEAGLFATGRCRSMSPPSQRANYESRLALYWQGKPFRESA